MTATLQGRLNLGGLRILRHKKCCGEAKTWPFMLQQIVMTKIQNSYFCA